MGLDMYLEKEIFIGAQYEHLKVTGTIALTKHTGTDKEQPIKVTLANVRSITECVGYWRKANQIHAWFVANVQSGVDDCGRYHVTYDKLRLLRDLCALALKTKDASLLPPQEGFFFGSTKVDANYWGDLQETVEIIDSCEPPADYYYQASW